jgi:hypothetical protein
MKKKIKWVVVGDGKFDATTLLRHYLLHPAKLVKSHQFISARGSPFLCEVSLLDPEQENCVPDELNYTLAEEGEMYVSFRTTYGENRHYISYGYLPMKISEEALSDNRKLPWQEWLCLLEDTMPFTEVMTMTLI